MEQLAQALQASKGSLSSMTRLLIQIGLIERTRFGQVIQSRDPDLAFLQFRNRHDKIDYLRDKHVLAGARRGIDHSLRHLHAPALRDDHTVRVWNLLSLSQTLQLTGHTENVNSAAFSPDGAFLASAGSDVSYDPGEARVWKPGTPGEVRRFRSTDGV